MCQKFMQVIHARALYDSDSQVYDIDYHYYIQAMSIDLRQR